MRTELIKVRSLPTPRWTALALLFCFLAGIAGTIAWGVGRDNDSLEVAVNFPLWIAALVFGVWIVGVEFGQDTMRRALAADPRRMRLILSKLGVALAIVAAATILLNAVGAWIYDLAGSTSDSSINYELAYRSCVSNLVSNVVVVLVGMGLTLATRSMAGGLTITLVFLFVLDGALSFIPKVGDYTLGGASGDLAVAISGNADSNFGEAATLEPVIAALVTAAWILVIFGAGVYRTLESDVK